LGADSLVTECAKPWRLTRVAVEPGTTTRFSGLNRRFWRVIVPLLAVVVVPVAVVLPAVVVLPTLVAPGVPGPPGAAAHPAEVEPGREERGQSSP